MLKKWKNIFNQIFQPKFSIHHANMHISQQMMSFSVRKMNIKGNYVCNLHSVIFQMHFPLFIFTSTL